MSDAEGPITCDRGPIVYPKTAGFSVPQEVYDAGYRPLGVPLPESLGGARVEDEEVDEHGAEIDDHLRDIRQGLLTITAELDQIGQSTQALMSSRLYWIEFTEGPEGPDFADELAEVGTNVRHLQRILAAAERASTS